MAASSNRQTTMAKMAREQAVRERRTRKQAKKDDRKQAGAGHNALGESIIPAPAIVDETPADETPIA